MPLVRAPMDALPLGDASVDLVVAIRRQITKQGWTQAAAAQRAGVGRTVMTAIVNCNLRGISMDRLLDVGERLGLKVGLKVA